ncbi:MAG TPA: DUF3822 family protein [Bacteroidales bacterium]|nr:DUF3822 family protein [Bacteroidales bacterium]
METENNTFTVKTDPCFGTAPATGYKLIAGLNGNSVQLLVFDPEKNKFIAFAQKKILNKAGLFGYFEHLKDFFTKNELISHQYRDVVVLWESQRSTLVPDALYETDERETYFYFNLGKVIDEKICGDKLKTAELYNVYGVPEELENNLGLKSFRMRHHGSAFIENVMIFSKVRMLSKQVFIHIHPAFFDMLVSENGRLLFYNSFAYKTAEDFIYFVLFVYGQLQLSPENNSIILSGGVLKNSALYDILFKYIRNIDFMEPGEQYLNSFILKDIPPHTIHNLTSVVLCEL